MKEEVKTNEIVSHADQKEKIKEQTVAWYSKFSHMTIDYKAVQLYFKKLREIIKPEDQFRESVSDLITAIEHTWGLACTGDQNSDHKLMCTRGLLILLHMECLEEFDW